MHLNEHFVKNAIPEVSFLYTHFPDKVTYSIDSRTLRPGDIFIALVGKKSDGHDFVVDAFNKGASGCIIAQHRRDCLNGISQDLRTKCVMLVPDVYSALQQLAAAWRSQFQYPVIAITGSVGKTSTKEILCNIFDVQGLHYVASTGNQNTLLGVALNILKMTAEHSVAVFEMGINKRGEMAQLVALARPTHALITGVGHAHMEGLGSIVDIAHEKRNIFALFTESNIGIINGDQPILAHVSYCHPVIKFGLKTTNQIQARKIHVGPDGIRFILKIYGEKYPIYIPSTHRGCVLNALAATAMAYLLQIPIASIIKAIQIPVVVSGRYEYCALKSGVGTIINDCYNASPESVKAALLALQKIDTPAQKIVVLGDMLELGVTAPFWHRQMGRFLRKTPSVRHVILVGSLVQWTKRTLPVNISSEIVPSWKEAVKAVEAKLDKESVVLIKGSRALELQNLVKALQ